MHRNRGFCPASTIPFARAGGPIAFSRVGAVHRRTNSFQQGRRGAHYMLSSAGLRSSLIPVENKTTTRSRFPDEDDHRVVHP